MIPKTIHYCWFGKKPLPPKTVEAIKTWTDYLPSFAIKQWDETNFDVNAMKYTRQAYFAKRYAFVSDVARLYALKTEGGIYLDTDVILKKSVPTQWLDFKGFTSFEHDRYVQTGVLACEPHLPVIEAFYESYKQSAFFSYKGFVLTPNVYRMTRLMQEHGFVMNNKQQMRDGFVIFPQVILSAKDWEKGRYDTEETIMLHDFAGTWGRDLLRHKYKSLASMYLTMAKWALWGRYVRLK